MAVPVVRIIAGEAKGRKLAQPRGAATRPMTDRAREALFSILGARLAEARVLDLFAGTGSLGLEALSRGAAAATFVEKGADTALARNVAEVGLGGEVVKADVAAYLRRADGTFEVVFVDPPYARPNEEVESDLAAVAGLLAPGGVVVVHRRAGTDPPSWPPGLAELDRRRYGDTVLWLLEPAG